MNRKLITKKTELDQTLRQVPKVVVKFLQHGCSHARVAIGISFGISVAKRPAPPPPNLNATNDKNVAKKTIVSFSIFAYKSTRVQQYLTTLNGPPTIIFTWPLI